MFGFGVKQNKQAGWWPQLVHFTYMSSFVFLDKCKHDCKVVDSPQLCHLVNIPHILITYIYTATEYVRFHLQNVKKNAERLI
jgi:hypothetical protein